MKQPCCAFLVAEEACPAQDTSSSNTSSGRIVGCVQIDWSGTANCGIKRPEVDAFFGMLSVKAEHSRRGIGRLLVASAGEKNASGYINAAHPKKFNTKLKYAPNLT